MDLDKNRKFGRRQRRVCFRQFDGMRVAGSCNFICGECGEDRLHLGIAQIDFDKLCCASAIKSTLLWLSACESFGIPLGLH